MEDKTTLGIIGIIALIVYAVSFLAYLHISRQPTITSAEIEKAREIVRRMERGR